MTIIFDGSTRVDEVLAVLFRYTTKKINIVQDLAHLRKYEKLKNHEQVIEQYGVFCATVNKSDLQKHSWQFNQ